MLRRKSTNRLRILILLLAGFALGAMLLRVAGILPKPSPLASATPSPLPTTTQSEFERPEEPAATGHFSPTEDPEGLETPADMWANAVLDYVLPILGENTAPVEGLSWWYTTPAGGILAWTNGAATVGQEPVEFRDGQDVEFAISDPDHPNSLRLIGEAKLAASALQLTLSVPVEGQESSKWLLSGAAPVLAIEALSAQASARQTSLTVAYASSGSTMQVVLLNAQTSTSPAEQSGTLTQSPPPTTVSTAAIPPTSTRAPDAFLGQVVASKIDPGIDEAQAINPALTQRFIDRHPWAGILATSEAGIRINNHATSIAHATEFVVYLLQDPSGNVTRLFSVEYTQDGTTRFPEDQLLFQAHRMEEILYWMVVRAGERDGQLIVAYDDFGERQTITLIGFRKFADSAP